MVKKNKSSTGNVGVINKISYYSIEKPKIFRKVTKKELTICPFLRNAKYCTHRSLGHTHIHSLSHCPYVRNRIRCQLLQEHIKKQKEFAEAIRIENEVME